MPLMCNLSDTLHIADVSDTDLGLPIRQVQCSLVGNTLLIDHNSSFVTTIIMGLFITIVMVIQEGGTKLRVLAEITRLKIGST